MFIFFTSFHRFVVLYNRLEFQGYAVGDLFITDTHLWPDKDLFLFNLDLFTDKDHYSLKVGIRTIAVEDGKILLNGKPVKLNGYGRHEDFFASGKDLYEPLIGKDYKRMRWTGANACRTSHDPYNAEEMMMADREGFLIIDEIPAVSLQFNNQENMAERMRKCLRQIDEMIARYKNHPSVVMWCVSNKAMPRKIDMATLGQTYDDSDHTEDKAFLDKLLLYTKEKDATRLVPLVAVMGDPLSWIDHCDVLCINHYRGWYILGSELGKARTVFEHEVDHLWDAFHSPIILTEFGINTIHGYHVPPNVM